jgi:hypothetical protein
MMRNIKLFKVYLTLSLLILPSLLMAQKSNSLPNRAFHFSVGPSLNGTGDAFGLAYNGSFFNGFSKKLCWFGEIGGSIHDGFDPIFYMDPNGNEVDGSVYYTTAGFQVVLGSGVALIRTTHNEIMLKVGLMPRYQSSSYYDFVATYYPSGTGLPFPVVQLISTEPHRTLSIGGSGGISYSYTFKNYTYISWLTSLQLDSNGDILTSVSFGVGKRF